AQLREPVALAYLLARATDSVADTTGISNVVRIETLKILSDGIGGKASRDVVVNLTASFVPLQANGSERQLLESLPTCLNWLDQLEQADHSDIRAVLDKITRGQGLLTAAPIRAEPERCQPSGETWLPKARPGAEWGVQYSRAIRDRRVRAATVLPALIGARTLALLDEAGRMALQRTVKVPRRE